MKNPAQTPPPLGVLQVKEEPGLEATAQRGRARAAVAGLMLRRWCAGPGAAGGLRARQPAARPAGPGDCRHKHHPDGEAERICCRGALNATSLLRESATVLKCYKKGVPPCASHCGELLAKKEPTVGRFSHTGTQATDQMSSEASRKTANPFPRSTHSHTAGPGGGRTHPGGGGGLTPQPTLWHRRKILT